MKQISADPGNDNALRILGLISGVASGVIFFAVSMAFMAEMTKHFLGETPFWLTCVSIPPAMIFAAGIGYVFYRGWLVGSSIYVDQVFDCGDHVLVENDGNRTKIWFDEIADVTYSYISPMRITILPVNATDKNLPVTFCPRNGITVRRVVQSLRDRIIEHEDDAKNAG